MEEDLGAQQTSLVVVVAVSFWREMPSSVLISGLGSLYGKQNRGTGDLPLSTGTPVPGSGQWLWTRSTRSSTNVHGVMFSVYFHFCSLRCNHVRLPWPKPNESNCKILEKAHIWHWSSSLLYVNRGSFLFFFFLKKKQLYFEITVDSQL